MDIQRFSSLQPAADLPRLQATLAVKGGQDSGEDRTWYSIRNVSRSEAEIYIYDEIGYWGTTANDFIKDLADIKASKISLRINSPGGDVFDGIAIYNALKRHPANITAHVDGIAASAASFIAMAGDEVLMAPHSQMMIHEASGLCIGPADDMRKMADLLDKSSNNIAGIYAKRTGGSTEEWRAKMRDETWFSDQEAVDAGLADAVDGDDVVNHVEPTKPEEKPGEPEVIEEPTRKPVDFGRLFEQIAEEADEALFAA